MRHNKTPSTPRRKLLRPGVCFKASRVACERNETGTIRVSAEEVLTVLGQDENPSEPCVNVEARHVRRNAASYERRRVFTSSPFKVTIPPRHLEIVRTENGTRIVDVVKGFPAKMSFPPMARVPGMGFRETNAAEVIFGLDPSLGHPWVTPVAFRLIKLMRTQVTQAGGVFVADFDTSESGWAVFRSIYVSPAPSKSLYVQACRVKPKVTAFFYGSGPSHVVEPLCLCGGRVYRDDFSPTMADLKDPVVFKSIRSILDEAGIPSAAEPP